jgi:Tfp pilus assembly protein PilV
MSTHARTKRRLPCRGSILIDSLIGLTILAMGAASFYSLFPIISKSHAISDQDQKATQIATKMLEHIQMLAPSTLTANNLTGMQLIDANQVAPPYTFTNCPLDNSTDFCPSKALKNGTGTLTLINLSYGSVEVLVTITWKNPVGNTETLTMGTVLGSYRS